jgi:replicative DNA helicase
LFDPIREQSLERSLPNSSEAERACLGGIILDNGLISQAIEMLRPEDFYVPSHRRIFIAMICLFERGAEINPILIGEELKKENALESVGGVSFITNLTYGLPHSTNIAHYAKVIRGKSYLRQLIKAANSITQEALEQEDEPEVIADHAEKAIFDLRDERIIKGKFESVRPIAEGILEHIQEQEGRQAVLTGITTGYVDLDQLTSGWQQQDLILIAARPSVGKTSLALMLAAHAAIHGEAVVGFFSLEMSKIALVMRLLCAQANVDSMRFRNGFLSKAEWVNIARALGSLTDARIFLDDTAGITVMEMRAKAMRLAEEQKKLNLIIVDFVQLMKGSKTRYQSDHEKLTEISHDLKGMAKEFNVPLIALSQLSRKSEDRTDHRPQVSDLRGSGTLEEDADVVAMLYRADQYKTGRQREEMPDDEKNVAELIVAKQRNGPTDVVKLRWTPSSTRFDNLYRE